jgi:hypothetical protein
MPRILRILNRFNLGGPTYNAAFLTKYLDKNFETLLIGGPNDPSEKIPSILLISLGLNHTLSPRCSGKYRPFLTIRLLIR